MDEEWFDDMLLYQELKERGVFIVPGRHFFTELDSKSLGQHPQQCFRVSITPDAATLAAGIEMIGQALSDMQVGNTRVQAHR